MVFVPLVIEPVSVPPNVPVPVARVRTKSVLPVTLLALPFASCDCTVTLNATPACGDAGLTFVTANLVAGAGVTVNGALSPGARASPLVADARRTIPDSAFV